MKWKIGIADMSFAMFSRHGVRSDCFGKLMIEKGLLESIEQEVLDSHEFFEVDPLHDVVLDDNDPVNVLLQEDIPTQSDEVFERDEEFQRDEEFEGDEITDVDASSLVESNSINIQYRRSELFNSVKYNLQ